MGKPKTRKDAFLQEKIKKLDEAKGLDPKFKREQRKILKKKQKKHIRGVIKRELRDRVKDCDKC